MKKIILFFALLFIQQGFINAQNGSITPDGTFDKVFDRFGNSYNLQDLRIDNATSTPGNGPRLDDYVVPAKLLCTSGMFNLYFEQGSGAETNLFTDVARRDVICQVFTDLSNFIVPADPDVKVNILVKNIENTLLYAGNTNVLGLATSFYTVPANPGTSGIIDGQIWRTINSGVDAYTNVTSPLVTQGPDASGAFYHGMMAFNFRNPAVQWHTDLTTTTAANTYDLYSTVLHEVTHALGFASLISSAGTSNFGTNYNYYSRYDLFLQDQNGNNLIDPVGSCDMYEYSFSLALQVLAPPHPLFTNCVTDKTYCINALKFAGSVNEAVYTPNCFEPGSSLSHLEDECHSSGVYQNNEYYCMSNAAGTGVFYMNRYLKPEERAVLCDLGYKVNTTYGNGLHPANYYDYGGSQCSGLEVAGVNDGINSNGTFTWSVAAAGNVNFTGLDLIGNDFNADEFDCLEVVNGLGTVNITNGTSAANITFTAGATNGIALLRYIPVNTSVGTRGNITYAYVSINTANCVPTACNMFMNSGFENGTNCGEIATAPDNATINCWQRLIETPDYLVRSCAPTSNVDKTVPTGVTVSVPATDAWNGGTGNDAFLGLGFLGGSEDAVQTLLSNPMQPGIKYTLSFWAKTANAPTAAISGENRIEFRSEANTLAPILAGNYTSTGQYLTETTIQDDGEWHYVTLQFTYNGTVANSNFLVGNMGNSGGTDSYVFIDDLNLYPTNDVARFEPHKALCEGVTTIDDLSEFIFPAMQPGASFSGPGVQLSGGIYSFVAPSNGKFTIFYNFTNSSGCTISIPAQIYVKPSAQRPNVTVISNPSTPPAVHCGTPVRLVASGAETYDWYSPFSIGANIPCTGNCASITVTPTAPGYLFVVIGSDSIGCKDTNEIFVAVECGTPGGGGVYEMPDNVKHYTTKRVPGTYNETIMVGTIFDVATPQNKIHFLRFDDSGRLLISVEYPSSYTDERAVDVQCFIDQNGDEVWYIVSQARTGTTDIIKVLLVDRYGNLLAQREYSDAGGLDYYPMHSTTWTNGEVNPFSVENRLYICGFQPDMPMGGGLPDYNTPKHAFVLGIDINIFSPTFLDVVMSNNYDWQAPGHTQDFDIATRIAAVNGDPNQLWVTGSVNAIKPIHIQGNPFTADERSATMNLVIDINGGVIADNPFLSFTGSDDGSGPLEYGIDLIQTDGGKYILGNQGLIQGNFVPGHPQSARMFYPRANLIWWIQPVDDDYMVTKNRQEFNNPWGHWAAHAIVTGPSSVTVATLMEWQYSTCIPLPYTPNYDNVQVNLVKVDLTTFDVPNSVVYMTSSGTGDPFAGNPNSFYDMGGPLSVIDYPPTFAAKGGMSYIINAPKYDPVDQLLNLKVLIPDLGTLYVDCGYFDVKDPNNCTQYKPYTVPWFLSTPIQNGPYNVMDMPGATNISSSNNVRQPYTIKGPEYMCFDQNGNPTYRRAAPPAPIEEQEEAKLNVYPNPATNAFFIETTVDDELEYTIQVFDIAGRMVYNHTATGKNKPKFEVNTSAFADGTYLVKVLSSGNTTFNETHKVIVMKGK